MMNRIFVFLLTTFFVAGIPALTYSQVWSDSLSHVDQLYRHGKFAESELQALRLISRYKDLPAVEKSELQRILAFISIARDDRVSGKEHFLEALELNPNFRLDRGLTSPKIYSVFEQAKEEFTTTEHEKIVASDEAVSFYRVRIDAGKRSMIFPGLGQMYKGHETRGIVLMSATGLSLAGLVVSQILVMNKDDDYHASKIPSEAEDLYEEYRTIWHVRNGFGIALGILWLGSTLDAFISEPDLDDNTAITLRVGSSFDDAVGIGLSLKF